MSVVFYIFNQMKACKKSLKNIFILPKKDLMLLRYSNFCTRLFSPVRYYWIYSRNLLEINPKNLEVIMYLNSWDKDKLFHILRSKEELILKLGELIEYYIRKIFMPYIMWNSQSGKKSQFRIKSSRRKSF